MAIVLDEKSLSKSLSKVKIMT